MTRPYLPFLFQIGTACVLVLLAAALLAAAGWSHHQATRPGIGRVGEARAAGYRRDAHQFTRWGAGILAGTILGAALLMWPYDMQYHQWRRVSGAVTTTPGHRTITTGSGGNRRIDTTYAVPVGGGVYRCDDTRCSLLHPGDQVTLWCRRVWQWSSTPGWVCLFGSSTEAP